MKSVHLAVRSTAFSHLPVQLYRPSLRFITFGTSTKNVSKVSLWATLIFIVSIVPLAAQHVGINTDAPQTTLHVAGQIRQDSALSQMPVSVAAGATINAPANTAILVVTDDGSAETNAITLGGTPLDGQWMTVVNLDAQSVFLGGEEIRAYTLLQLLHQGGVWRSLSAAEADPNAWGLQGNAATTPTTHFVGTTDAQPLAFRVDDTERMRLTEAGHIRLNPVNNNHVIGNNAGVALTSGGLNTMFGFNAGASTTTGPNNVFIGAYAGANSTTAISSVYVGTFAGTLATGSQNTYIGSQAGMSSTTANLGVIIGFDAGRWTTTGAANQFVGYNAGFGNTTGTQNYYSGFQAGRLNSVGSRNVAIGYQAGENNTVSENQFVGYRAGHQNTTGTQNTYMGYEAGRDANTASDNTYTGYQAGISTTTGGQNAFYGALAGQANTIGFQNTLVGAESGALSPNSANNAFVGYRSGYNCAGCASNVFVGSLAGQASTVNSNNVFVGYSAGFNTTTPQNNTYVGNGAGFAATTAERNTVIGSFSGYDNTASNQVIIGFQAGLYNTTGANNTFIGYRAGRENETGNSITAIGHNAGYNNFADNNHFLGFEAGYSNTVGVLNHFDGYRAGYASTGSNNFFVGHSAGRNNTTGQFNTFIGFQAGLTGTAANANTTGSNNTYIGYNAGSGNATQHTNAAAIGYEAKVTASNAMVLGGTGANAVNVGIGVTAPTSTLHIAATGTASLRLAGTTSAWANWGATGFGAPTFTTRSLGTKAVFYDQLSATNVDYAMGVESFHLWQSVPQATSAFGHKFYGGTTQILNIRGDGNLISPKWRVTRVYNQAAGLPAATNLTTGGGTLVCKFSASGFRNVGAGIVQFNLFINGVLRGSTRTYTNENLSHKATVPAEIVVTGLAAGTYTVQITAGTDTLNDANDYFDLTVVEYPF